MEPSITSSSGGPIATNLSNTASLHGMNSTRGASAFRPQNLRGNNSTSILTSLIKVDIDESKVVGMDCGQKASWLYIDPNNIFCLKRYSTSFVVSTTHASLRSLYSGNFWLMNRK
ncbi:hypothetical protein O6H91_15G017600 [Diphasiastrum complanatum]|uniref:Uncharacterized protein n=1 Tax=Diphasiastrum complanatum TaxID=34168 RepID=A0ACC2BG65_DIPCM|nr:hypothetical protein O6H91_15G017600 [Diphasiastrum complanatum]